MTSYEAWRPALVAFYAANGQSQGALNIRNGMRLTDSDRLTIDGLRAATGITAAKSERSMAA